jgi:hypothetical protein
MLALVKEVVGAIAVAKIVELPWLGCCEPSANHILIDENYSRSLELYFRFLEQLHSSCVVVTRAEVGLYLASLQVDGARLSNATTEE